MKVKVQFFAFLRDEIGKKEDEFECDCSSPEELLEELFKRYPKLKEEDEQYKRFGLELKVLVNGREWKYLDSLKGDEVEVALFPPAAGG
ncbi:MoaD family protein [Ignicoccus hospitalis KIN4/I]|uniref:MoaD family protein n=1 Tax=Ignicoccus hospitalis (strain KIN4/I / DSM 18386 / JCM 14125) TaxID=453591 RepID=A8AAQ0_IGNH4|nr:MoaD family protein [Ignicoccus hospitalis KIN4/I]HIH89840.1 MoaD family protein [Desulfurococcaceae archaeon]